MIAAAILSSYNRLSKQKGVIISFSNFVKRDWIDMVNFFGKKKATTDDVLDILIYFPRKCLNYRFYYWAEYAVQASQCRSKEIGERCQKVVKENCLRNIDLQP